MGLVAPPCFVSFCMSKTYATLFNFTVVCVPAACFVWLSSLQAAAEKMLEEPKAELARCYMTELGWPKKKWA